MYQHLAALTDDRGVFEHAEFDVPRVEHGYCVDDVARALLVVVREPAPPEQWRRVAAVSLRFLEEAVRRDGRAHNRYLVGTGWADEPGVGDWWGRALWALGAAATGGMDAATARRARRVFDRASARRSDDLRAMAFATLGATDVLAARPRHRRAHTLIAETARLITAASQDASGPWPEPRLRYANAVLPEALIAAGHALGDAAATARGLAMLDVLLDIETRDGHLSVTGMSGRALDERDRQFDQQPIEVAAIADAAARAFAVTGDERWREVVAMSWAWFVGDNDSDAVMVDFETGAGYDGLTETGRNENRGAESTLAMLSTYQQARRAGVLSRVRAWS